VRNRIGVLAVTLLVALAIGCGAESGDTESWAAGEVSVDGATYPVDDLTLELEFGEWGYYSISGYPTTNEEEDCVPGLAGGLFLYGSIPASADEPHDLAGVRLPVEFSGDGDDANLCFLGMDGLLGARDAWLTFDSVDGDRVVFTMSGSFDFYDGDGGMGSARQASARGDAQITEIYQ
jgi:hypothetical protein